jgi:hypothetical protein
MKLFLSNIGSFRSIHPEPAVVFGLHFHVQRGLYLNNAGTLAELKESSCNKDDGVYYLHYNDAVVYFWSILIYRITIVDSRRR